MEVGTLARMRQAVPWLLAAILLVVLAGIGQASTRIAVELAEWTLGFEEMEAEAGKIEFYVVNEGRMPHNFRLDWTDERGEQYGVETPVLQPGQEYRLIVTLGTGTYELWCSIPGHAELGMAATLLVTN